MLRGLAAVDRRSVAARTYLDTRAAVVDQLGGEDQITATQAQLVEIVARGLLYLGHLDAVLLERKTILNKTGRRLIPLVHDRRVLADSIAKQLALLGFSRVTGVRSLTSELLDGPAQGSTRPGAR
jgi:hypothetical protein